MDLIDTCAPPAPLAPPRPLRPPLAPPTPGTLVDTLPPAPLQRRRRRGTATAVRLLLGGALLGAVALDPSVLVGLVALFVVIVPFEKLFPRHRGQRVRRPALGTDIAYLLLAGPLAVASIAVGAVISLASLAWLPALALRPLVGALPGPLYVVGGVLLFDAAVYWVHRWSHEVPFLWRFHSIHHSTRHLDWVSGVRAHPVDGVLVAPPIVFLLVAGFDPAFTGVLAVVQILTGLFLHANVRWRWRPLHRIVITPEFHHWHHSSEREAVNTNYSVFLPAWDLLFGTYRMPADRRPQMYGVAAPIPDGIVEQLRYPLVGLVRLRWVVRHPIQAVRRAGGNVRRGLRQIARSTRRRRRPFVHSA